MMGPHKDKHKAVRTKPTQARSKERVRLILAAALELFKEKGIEETSTNDIAQRAGVPIGSLYRYFPHKDSITTALTEQYVDDISKIFTTVGKHPMLPYLSWDEVLSLMVDGWVQYSRQHGPFRFWYAHIANPKLRLQNAHSWDRFIAVFTSVLKKRCPSLDDRQTMICFKFCATAVGMGVDTDRHSKGSLEVYHEAVGAVAAYMLRICSSTGHHDDGILP